MYDSNRCDIDLGWSLSDLPVTWTLQVMTSPTSVLKPLNATPAWSNYDIMHEIFSYFKSPYDEGYHNGDMLLSFLLVNKFWASIVIERLWSRLKSDRPLIRLLLLDYAAPQDGGKLKLARCSFRKVRYISCWVG
jgi:hypothetical protein